MTWTLGIHEDRDIAYRDKWISVWGGISPFLSWKDPYIPECLLLAYFHWFVFFLTYVKENLCIAWPQGKCNMTVLSQCKSWNKSTVFSQMISLSSRNFCILTASLFPSSTQTIISFSNLSLLAYKHSYTFLCTILVFMEHLLFFPLL